jgi:hypothetical protein
MNGSKVEVYSSTSVSYLDDLIDAFDGRPADLTIERLMDSINEVEPNSVVFNWECSSGYANKIFPEGARKLFTFLKLIIDRGHMAMFSDFALKALIHNWNEEYELGPNPFVQIGSHGGNT